MSLINIPTLSEYLNENFINENSEMIKQFKKFKSNNFKDLSKCTNSQKETVDWIYDFMSKDYKGNNWNISHFEYSEEEKSLWFRINFVHEHPTNDSIRITYSYLAIDEEGIIHFGATQFSGINSSTSVLRPPFSGEMFDYGVRSTSRDVKIPKSGLKNHFNY